MIQMGKYCGALLDFAFYFILFALFVYGVEEVHASKGKFLVVLVLVVGSIYEYYRIKSTGLFPKYFSMYYKIKRLIYR